MTAVSARQPDVKPYPLPGPMRIALFTDTFLPQVNGVVRSIVTLANQLAARDHRVAVFTMEVDKLGNGGAGRGEDLDGRIEVFPFRSVPLPGFREVQAHLPTLVGPLRVARRFDPDVIHLHTIFTVGWEAIWIARLLGRPLVGSHHGFLAEYLSNFGLDFEAAKVLMRRFLAFYYNRCSAVITPAQALRRELLQYRLRREIHVISNPIDLKLFSAPASRGSKRLLPGGFDSTLIHVGRLVRQKSVDVLLRAYAILRRQGAGARLLVIGDGCERAALQDLAGRLGIADGVHWAGMLSGKPLVEHLASADVFVSASTTEVQPLSFLEAMALGLPAIGVAAGGVPELVQHERTGLVVSPNDPVALAGAMQRMLCNPEQRTRYGVEARRQATCHDAVRVVPAIEAVYRSLIGPRVPASGAA